MAKKRVLLLVDGDMVAFSHCAAEEYGKEEDEISFARIQMSMESKMEFMKNRLGATDTIVLISGDTNMRHVIAEDYKSNRDGVWRPDNLRNAKAALITMYNGVKCDGLEADDLCRMLSLYDYELVMGKRGEIKELIYKGASKYDEVIIASLDKDLAQIGQSVTAGAGPVIKHYKWETQHAGEKLTEVSGFGDLRVIIKGGKTKKVVGTGAKFFLWQLLTGDATDGIMGCGVREKRVYKSGAKCGQEYFKRDGVGAIEAFELLEDCTNYSDGLNRVATKYIMRFADGWKEQLTKNGRLLYMHGFVEKGHFVRLWNFNNVVEWYDLKSKTIVNSI